MSIPLSHIHTVDEQLHQYQDTKGIDHTEPSISCTLFPIIVETLCTSASWILKYIFDDITSCALRKTVSDSWGTLIVLLTHPLILPSVTVCFTDNVLDIGDLK